MTLKSSVEIEKVFKGTFDTDLGRKCLQHLEEVFVDRAVARTGDDLLQIGIRQGEANAIKQIIKNVKGTSHGNNG